ncbi:hypothetical protein Mapa_007164 [Marchantia paleacea]|nr:hypothetical protein Mapa_007164 [Marchantia paleacea]
MGAMYTLTFRTIITTFFTVWYHAWNAPIIHKNNPQETCKEKLLEWSPHSNQYIIFTFSPGGITECAN